MKSRLAMFTTALALMVVGATGTASAATEFGDTCEGSAPFPPFTVTAFSSSEASLPLTAPVGGVLTKIKMKTAIPLPFALPEQIKVLRSAGGNNYTVTHQTEIGARAGETVADVRIPIQAGDRLGMRGLPFTYEGSKSEGLSLICAGAGKLGVSLGDVAEGATAEFVDAGEARLPLRGVIEPDADNDGYGDETQDGCAQSAAVQVPCPLIVLDAVPVPGSKTVLVYVAGSSEGAVTVKGVAKLGKGKKSTLKAGPKTVSPGKITKFKLKLSGKVSKRLQELEPSKKLTLKITASATNVAGLVSTDKTKIKLKGQA
jgi:hypothetical protein